MRLGKGVDLSVRQGNGSDNIPLSQHRNRDEASGSARTQICAELRSETYRTLRFMVGDANDAPRENRAARELVLVSRAGKQSPPVRELFRCIARVRDRMKELSIEAIHPSVGGVAELYRVPDNGIEHRVELGL